MWVTGNWDNNGNRSGASGGHRVPFLNSRNVAQGSDIFKVAVSHRGVEATLDVVVKSDLMTQDVVFPEIITKW